LKPILLALLRFPTKVRSKKTKKRGEIVLRNFENGEFRPESGKSTRRKGGQSGRGEAGKRPPPKSDGRGKIAGRGGKNATTALKESAEGGGHQEGPAGRHPEEKENGQCRQVLENFGKPKMALKTAARQEKKKTRREPPRRGNVGLGQASKCTWKKWGNEKNRNCVPLPEHRRRNILLVIKKGKLRVGMAQRGAP